MRARRSASLVLAAVLAGATLAGCTQPPPPPAPLPVGIGILGDSGSAGNAAGDYAGPTPDDPEGKCFRSPHAYGPLLYGLIPSNGLLSNKACSGARNANLVPQALGVPETQRSEVDLLLFTTGGNDAEFGNLAAACFALIHITGTTDGAGCDQQLRLLEADQAQRVADIVEEARGQMEQLLQLFPNATLVWVGYSLFDQTPGMCLTVQGRPCFDPVARVRSLIATADALQEATAADLRTTYGPRIYTQSISQAFEGHGHAHGTAPTADTWIQAPLTGLREEWYHPNRAGHAAIAQLLLQNEGVRRVLCKVEPERFAVAA